MGSLRMTARSLNALKLVEYLEAHSKVLKVELPNHKYYESIKQRKKILVACYPFEVEGGREAGGLVNNGTKLMSITCGLGDTKTWLLHPANDDSWLHDTNEEKATAGITKGLISCIGWVRRY